MEYSIEFTGAQLVDMVQLNCWTMTKLVNDIKFTKGRPNQNERSRQAISHLADQIAHCKGVITRSLPLALGHLLATDEDHIRASALKLKARLAITEGDGMVTSLLLNALQLGE